MRHTRTRPSNGLFQHVRAENGSLVAADNVVLERLGAVLPANTSVALGFGGADGRSFGLFDSTTAARRTA